MILLAGFLQKIEQWDRSLFNLVNQQWTNPLFDQLMPFLRNSLHWAPLYLFLAVFAILNFREKGAWWSVFFLATVAITDLVGNYGFKHVFDRLRPCNDPTMQVRLLVECGSGFSFISNHAANHFGMGVFFLLTFRKVIGKWAWLGIAWAVSICFAQVYVGIHYPFDTLAGAMVGILAGSLTSWVFRQRFGLADTAYNTRS
jgi:membrane-associated phospholipid phosphatase